MISVLILSLGIVACPLFGKEKVVTLKPLSNLTLEAAQKQQDKVILAYAYFSNKVALPPSFKSPNKAEIDAYIINAKDVIKYQGDWLAKPDNANKSQTTKDKHMKRKQRAENRIERMKALAKFLNQ
jgi:hypothetical protein